MRLLYNLSIRLYYIIIWIASLLSIKKAQLWINGRRKIFHKIQNKIETHKKIIWFHCASLGEFEQGRPVIEKLKSMYPQKKILLTFFSPSGYEVRKNYELADFIFYLPIDSPGNAKKFIQIIKPDMVFFIKYEFWFNYLRQLRKNNIPVFIISAIFRKNQHFFRSYGSWFKKQLCSFTYWSVQFQF